MNDANGPPIQAYPFADSGDLTRNDLKILNVGLRSPQVANKLKNSCLFIIKNMVLTVYLFSVWLTLV